MLNWHEFRTGVENQQVKHDALAHASPCWFGFSVESKGMRVPSFQHIRTENCALTQCVAESFTSFPIKFTVWSIPGHRAQRTHRILHTSLCTFPLSAHFVLFSLKGFIKDPKKKLNTREILNIFHHCDIDKSGNLDMREFMFNIIVSTGRPLRFTVGFSPRRRVNSTQSQPFLN